MRLYVCESLYTCMHMCVWIGQINKWPQLHEMLDFFDICSIYSSMEIKRCSFIPNFFNSSCYFCINLYSSVRQLESEQRDARFIWGKVESEGIYSCYYFTIIKTSLSLYQCSCLSNAFLFWLFFPYITSFYLHQKKKKNMQIYM